MRISNLSVCKYEHNLEEQVEEGPHRVRGKGWGGEANMQEREQRPKRGAGQQKWAILIGKYKGISQGRIHSKESLLSSRTPRVLAAQLAKASSSLTILQKKAQQKTGPTQLFLNARVSFKWDCREEGARKRVLIRWSCK